MTDHLTKNHPESPNGVDDVSKNPSAHTTIAGLIDLRLSRRMLLKATCIAGGLGLAGSAPGAAPHRAKAPNLGFKAVAKHIDDTLAVPPGYTATVLYRTGDPIDVDTPDYANDGSDPAASFATRAGDHHDGMAWFGLRPDGRGRDRNNAQRGLLCINHENISDIFLHTADELAAGTGRSSRPAAQIDKEVLAHGVSIIEISRSSAGFGIDRTSPYNRRITAATPMEMSGPARGDALLRTRYSPNGTRTRGTLNNCANGSTPWGTYLTCEENWAGYFRRPASSSLTGNARLAQERYFGAAASDGSYRWASGDADGSGLYARWDLTPSGIDGVADYRNAANTFGWVVEIDPYAPGSVPKKRTALGRFGHEGAMPGPAVAGRPLVFYMGDDARGEYIYKYVSRQPWHPADANGGLAAGDKYLDDGRLYVARFDADGSGRWLELSLANIPAADSTYAFANPADVLIHARLAADALGATPMDRPEWTGVHPLTGDIYVTLTNNSERGQTGHTAGGMSRGLDAANPRHYTDDKRGKVQSGNVNGHIVRLREAGRDPAAESFEWDIYLFGSESGADPKINLSGLTADNDFSSPDGLWFSQATPGLLWLETDDGAYTDVSNCMLLAALPGQLGDGQAIAVENAAVPANGGAPQTVPTLAGQPATERTLRRFLVGPKGCEITGLAETPDGRALFVNIQHPGEGTRRSAVAENNPAAFESHWPQGGKARPRSATIVITRDDGGVVGS